MKRRTLEYFCLALVLSPTLACKSGSPLVPGAKRNAKITAAIPRPKSLLRPGVLIRAEIANPTGDPSRVTTIDYKIDAAGRSTEGQTDVDVLLEAGESVELEFMDTFPLQKDDALESLQNGEIPIRVTGAANFEGGGSAPFDRSDTLVIGVLPQFAIHAAQAATYGKQGVEVDIAVRLTNENSFTVLFEGVEYSLFVNGEKVREEQAAIGVSLLAGQAQELETRVALEPKTSPLAAKIVAAGSLEYQIKGRIMTVGLTVPIDLTGTITLAGR